MSHKPRKRFGQNFLHDTTIIDAIIAALHCQTGDHFVEIGPGLGALTAPLLQQPIRLDAIEIDRDLAKALYQRFHDQPQFTLHCADVLHFDLRRCVVAETPLRLVGNLPYNISTPLLFHVLEYAPIIRDMHFMLQKEVVARMCAAPGSHDYGRLSVMLQYRCTTEHLFDVPPQCFRPAPQVTSSVVRLIPHAVPPVDVGDVQIFARLISQVFAQRRKTLRNTLKNWLDAAQIEELGIDPQSRPETLHLAQFAALSRRLSHLHGQRMDGLAS